MGSLDLPKGAADAATAQFGNEQLTLSGTVTIEEARPGFVFEDPASSLKFENEKSLVNGKLTIETGPHAGVYIITELVRFRDTPPLAANAIVVAKAGEVTPPEWAGASPFFLEQATIAPSASASLCSNLFTDVYDFVTSSDGLLNPVTGVAAALSQTGLAAVTGGVNIAKGIGAGVKGVFDQSSNTGGALLGQAGALSGEIVGTVEGILGTAVGTSVGKAEAVYTEGKDAIVQGLDTVSGIIQGFAANNPNSMTGLKDLMDVFVPDMSLYSIEFPDLCPEEEGPPGAQFGDKGSLDRSFSSGAQGFYGSRHPSTFGAGAFFPSESASVGSSCGSKAAVNQFSKMSRDDDARIKEARELAFTDESQDKREHYTGTYKELTLRLDQNELEKDFHWQVWVYDSATQQITGTRAQAVSLWTAAGGGA